jgi:hypothetical protein
MLPSIADIAEHFQMLVSIAENCRTLSSIVEHCRALSSIARNQAETLLVLYLAFSFAVSTQNDKFLVVSWILT